MAKKIKTSQNESLKSKFRFVILNDATFEEKFSMILSRRNVWIFLSSIVVILIILTASAIVYTPLKYFIPGFGDYNYRSQIVALKINTDSLERTLASRNLKTEVMLKILNDSTLTDPKDMSLAIPKKIAGGNTELPAVSEAEKDLRSEVNDLESFAINYGKRGKIDAAALLNEYHFMQPTSGVVTDEYNINTGHYGIDIAAKRDQAVQSTLDGTVISTGFEVETGYTITIQHKDNLVTHYKHNAKLFKSVGNLVKAGDIIAAVGSTGSTSTGPHLHFEIWHLGKPLNPKDFIVF
jgi:murein DD-endopeptidase MepM/ murein hydrolase activator NlpD